MMRTGGIFGKGGLGSLGSSDGLGTTPMPGMPDMSKLPPLLLAPTSGVYNPFAAAVQSVMRVAGAPEVGSTKKTSAGRVYAPNQPPDGLWADCSQMAAQKLADKTPIADFVHGLMNLDAFGVPKGGTKTWNDPNHARMYCQSNDGSATPGQDKQVRCMPELGPLALLKAAQQLPPANICDQFRPNDPVGTWVLAGDNTSCGCAQGWMTLDSNSCPQCDTKPALPDQPDSQPPLTPIAQDINPLIGNIIGKKISSLFTPPAPAPSSSNIRIIAPKTLPTAAQASEAVAAANRLKLTGLAFNPAQMAAVAAGNGGLILGLLLVAAIGGGAWYYYDQKKKKELAGAAL